MLPTAAGIANRVGGARDHTEERQLGVLGEPRVNVLRLDLALDAPHPDPNLQRGLGS